jgi:5-methyltetrahydrofolate--homocysteine methyltransferase
MPDLRKRLSEPGILILDGATGTELQKLGLPAGMAPELWNLQNPEAVKKNYQAYIDAGADIILTNSFGGTRARLALEDAADQVHDINVAAARLAREVAGDSVLVLGSMGPSGVLMTPMGELTFERAIELFAEQAAALAEGGVDGIHIETMSDLQEARAAVVGARQATDLPITITMSFDMHGRTMMGVKPEDAVKELAALDVVAIGVNCGRTLEENLVALTAMRTAAPDAVLIAKPNAGMPRIGDEGEAVYDVTPEYMADYATRFGEQHVKILGGCCGSTPAHIRAVKEAMTDFVASPLDEVLARNRRQSANQEPGNRRRRRDSRRQ